MTKINLVVCDLDGTLSDHTPRMHLAAAGDWDKYHEGLAEDSCNHAVLWFIRQMSGKVVFLTGRPDNYRVRTQTWLEVNCNLCADDDYIALLMREKGETGSDVDLKPAKLEAFLEEIKGEYGIELERENILILEDRDKMVARWRDLGYNCWQVAEGSF